MPFVKKAHPLAGGLMELTLERLPSRRGQLSKRLRSQHLPLPALGEHERIARLRQQAVPGPRLSVRERIP